LNSRPELENAAGSDSYRNKLHKCVEALHINEKYALDRETGKLTVNQLLLTMVFEGVVEFVDFFGCTPVTSAPG